jgi:hypothetical protein
MSTPSIDVDSVLRAAILKYCQPDKQRAEMAPSPERSLLIDRCNDARSDIAGAVLGSSQADFDAIRLHAVLGSIRTVTHDWPAGHFA